MTKRFFLFLISFLLINTAQSKPASLKDLEMGWYFYELVAHEDNVAISFPDLKYKLSADVQNSNRAAFHFKLCNHFQGKISQHGDVFAVNDLKKTMMSCELSLMQAEKFFRKIITEPFKMEIDGKSLTLKNKFGMILFINNF